MYLTSPRALTAGEARSITIKMANSNKDKPENIPAAITTLKILEIHNLAEAQN